MWKLINGKYLEMTAEEIAKMQAEEEQREREYWRTIPYDEAVNNEIRKKYTLSQELAIQRQEKTKPEEFRIYDEYCEACKAYVKSKKGLE